MYMNRGRINLMYVPRHANLFAHIFRALYRKGNFHFNYAGFPNFKKLRVSIHDAKPNPPTLCGVYPDLRNIVEPNRHFKTRDLIVKLIQYSRSFTY
jgi:hypothetical protein